MDTCPNFRPFLENIENKHHQKDALKILKHVWGLLDKAEQKELLSLLNMAHLMHLSDKESKHLLEECKHIVATHPHIIEVFNKFYTKVVTPVSSKDQFKNDRIKAASGLENMVKQLQNKQLVKHFDIKRVA